MEYSRINLIYIQNFILKIKDYTYERKSIFNFFKN